MLTRARSIRRADSRDDARKHPHYPKPPQYGAVAEIVYGRIRLPEARLGTTSGQRRVNAKRTARGEYWRTVQVCASTEIEPHFRRLVHVLGEGAHVCGSTPYESGYWRIIDVHIPGAPANAVAARPVISAAERDGHYEPVLDVIEYLDAAGQCIETAEQLAEVAS